MSSWPKHYANIRLLNPLEVFEAVRLLGPIWVLEWGTLRNIGESDALGCGTMAKAQSPAETHVPVGLIWKALTSRAARAAWPTDVGAVTMQCVLMVSAHADCQSLPASCVGEIALPSTHWPCRRTRGKPTVDK